MSKTALEYAQAALVHHLHEAHPTPQGELSAGPVFPALKTQDTLFTGLRPSLSPAQAGPYLTDIPISSIGPGKQDAFTLNVY